MSKVLMGRSKSLRLNRHNSNGLYGWFAVAFLSHDPPPEISIVC